MRHLTLCISIVIAFTYLLTGCFVLKSTNSDLINELSYDISIVPFSLDDDSTIKFDIAQISNMEDVLQQKKINEALLLAETEWVTKECDWMKDSTVEVVQHSSNFLTISREIILEEEPHFRYILLYVTIDLQTGSRMMLDDFIDLNDDFYQKMQTEYQTAAGYKLFESWSIQDIEEMLKFANMTEKEYLSLKQSSSRIASVLLDKPSFCFNGEEILLKYTNTWGDYIIINMDGSFSEKTEAGG